MPASLARVYLDAGNVGRAVEEYKRALAMDAEFEPASDGLSEAYLAQGQFNAARVERAVAQTVGAVNAAAQGRDPRASGDDRLAEAAVQRLQRGAAHACDDPYQVAKVCAAIGRVTFRTVSDLFAEIVGS